MVVTTVTTVVDAVVEKSLIRPVTCGSIQYATMKTKIVLI